MSYQSEIILLSSPSPTDGTDTEDLSSGGNIYVGQYVNVIDEGTNDDSTPIYCNGYGSAIIDGFVYGYNGLIFAGATGQMTTIEIGTTGNVSNFGGGSSAVEVQTGTYNIDNAGVIQATHYAVDLDFNGTSDAFGSGGGTLTNTGVIEANAGDAIEVGDSSTNGDQILNYGTIAGGIYCDSGSVVTIDNTGSITGAGISAIYEHANTAGVALRNEGTIDGAVLLTNAGSSLVDAGKIESAVTVNGKVDITSAGVLSPTGAGVALTTTGSSYDIENAGEIVSQNGDGVDLSTGGTLVNTGSISSSGGYAVKDDSGSGSAGDLYNYGTISGPGSGAGTYDAVNETGGHSVTIFNYGAIDGGSDGQSGSAIYADSSTLAIVFNSGKISGQVALGASSSELVDSGTIDGMVTVPGVVDVTGSGVITSDQTALNVTSSAYDVKNAGHIASVNSFGITISDGGGSLVNTGTIAGTVDDAVDDNSAAGLDGYLYNYGTIIGPGPNLFAADAIHETGGHAETIFNTGVIEGGSDGANGSAIYGGSNTPVALHNAGEIDGQVALEAPGSYIDNSGRMEGWITLAGETTSGTTDLVNGLGGVISSDSLHTAVTVIAGPFYIINRGEISATSSGTSAAAGLTLDAGGGAGGTINNSGTIAGDGYGIDDSAASGAEYLYNSGTISALNKAAVYDGQNSAGTAGHTVELYNTGTIEAPQSALAVYASSRDKEVLDNRGKIEGAVDLTAAGSSVLNWGAIDGGVTLGAADASVLNDGSIDGNVVFTGAGDVFNGALGQVAGEIFGGGAGGVYTAGVDAETFNFAASGAVTAHGGAGADTFIFTAAGLTAATTIVGGAGADTVQFSTAGTIAASAFAHVKGIAAITLANGTNSLTIGNALATSAEGGALTINGGTGADTINVAAVSTASDHVTIYCGGGEDAITAGAAVDTFGYHAVSDSTGSGYDTISGVNFTHDYFDVSAVAGSIAAINAAVKTGTLSSGASFNSELGAAIGASQLGAGDAVLFTPNAGTLAGDTFLIVDCNDKAGYTANADLVIRLSGATGTLTTANFV